jgi:hypothetical protein
MRFAVLLSMLLVAGTGGVRADHGADFFKAQVLPILRSRCYECHSRGHRVDGGLALDSRAGWEAGGDHGPAVVPFDLRKSPIIRAIHHVDRDSAMPPKQKIPSIEIAMLETWVLLGAPDPRPSSASRAATVR